MVHDIFCSTAVMQTSFASHHLFLTWPPRLHFVECTGRKTAMGKHWGQSEARQRVVDMLEVRQTSCSRSRPDTQNQECPCSRLTWTMPISLLGMKKT